MACRCALVVGRIDLVWLQDHVDRHALGQVERDRLVGLAHAAGDVGRNFHADRLGAAARRDQHRRVLGKTLETLNSLRTTGFGGDHQSAVAVVVAYQDNAAPAQFCHGAFDGGERGRSAGMTLTRDHAFLYHAAGLSRSEPLFPPHRTR